MLVLTNTFKHGHIVMRHICIVNTHTRQKNGKIYKKHIGKLVILPMCYIFMRTIFLRWRRGQAPPRPCG